MLTDMTPSAGQFYGSQIPTMGMNIASHIQKPTVSVSAVSKIRFFFGCLNCFVEINNILLKEYNND